MVRKSKAHYTFRPYLHTHNAVAWRPHRHTRGHRGDFARVRWCWCGVASGFFDKSSYASMRRRLYGTARTTYIECMHNMFNCKQARYAHTLTHAPAHTQSHIVLPLSSLALSLSPPHCLSLCAADSVLFTTIISSSRRSRRSRRRRFCRLSFLRFQTFVCNKIGSLVRL